MLICFVKTNMSLTEGLSKEEVMTWRPEKLADYMRQLKLSSCDKVVLNRRITGAQFMHMIQHELEVFPILSIPILAKIQKDLNKPEKKKTFYSKFRTQNHPAQGQEEKVQESNEFDSDSDEYEEFQQEAADGNYIVPLNEPHAAESPQNTKAEDHRFPRPPGPQKVFKGPCHPMDHPYNSQQIKKPQKPPLPPQKAFPRPQPTEGSVAMATGSHTNSRQIPAIPQRTVFTRVNNQTPNVPVPAPRTHLSEPTNSSRQVLDPSWYRGRITRHQAEVSLREVNKDGAFLVRDSSHSSSQHPYTLMLLYQAKIFNIKIQKQNEYYYLGNGTKNTKSFLGVREMIIHHMNTPLLLIDAADQGSEEQLQCCLLHPAGL